MAQPIPPNQFRRAARLALCAGLVILALALGRLAPAAAQQSASFLFQPRGFSVISSEPLTSTSFQVESDAGRSVVGESASSSYAVSDDPPASPNVYVFLPVMLH